jgi:hypothetical protein
VMKGSSIITGEFDLAIGKIAKLFLMISQKVVTPAKAGVQCFCNHLIFLDAGFRRHECEVDFDFLRVCHFFA